MFNKSVPYHEYMHDRKTLYAPADNVIMMSMTDFAHICPSGLEIYTKGQNSSDVLLWKGCDHGYTNPCILEVNTLTLQWFRARVSCMNTPLCTRVYFSFHQKSKVPERLSSGLYNCSVDYYWRFQQHLDCNLKVECEDGRDEAGHCPFSSLACDGWVAVRNKCFMYVRKETLDSSVKREQSTHRQAIEFCASLNASIGMVRNDETLRALYDIFRERIPMKMGRAAIGLSVGDIHVPSMYRRSIIAYDKTAIHHSLNIRVSSYGREMCTIAVFHQRSLGSYMSTYSCSSFKHTYEKLHAICEFTIHGSDQYHNNIVRLSNASFALKSQNVHFSRCPNDHMVHTFLSCYPHYSCGQTLSHPCASSAQLVNGMDSLEGGQLMTPVPIFLCGDGVTRLSYTLVCDFRHHCRDGSDETFCQHPSCDAFACSNGQCVSYIKRCNLVSDCLDDSDELICTDYIILELQFSVVRSPVYITFDGVHSFKVKKMSDDEVCPETHYRCPGEYNDCIPVYTRCNGWYDCMDYEDEEACENMACPGFYHCFNSTICAHAVHLCDGWPHCPQHDDEWLCDMTCPTQCLCQGQVFLCHEHFSAHLFPEVRSVDAKGSGMTPDDFHNNTYIVHLSLSNCSLNFLPVMTFPNLQFLDLSANNLTIHNTMAYANLLNLRTLLLARNPIDLIHYDPNSTVQLGALHTIDLSHTTLAVFDSRTLSNTIYVQCLNLSFSTIHTVHPNGFQYTPKLTHLYLAGNPINSFSPDLFKPLAVLDTLSSQTYKLCCREILPVHFEIISCDAPRDEVSSCEDLLQSGMYRVCLWLITFLSLLGNVFCLVVRVCVQRTASTSGFHVFVTNLSIADLLMGVYIVIIGADDSLFRGQYLFFDETWKHSVACKVAGFLSLLSCEVSALTIWLITLDRFIVLHFPFTGVRFQRTSAAGVCLFTWLVGLLLGLIPLMPVTSHWEFFSQTGICIPLPVIRQDFKGKAFSVGVFIIFNFVLNPFMYTFNILMEKRRKSKEALILKWLESNSDMN